MEALLQQIKEAYEAFSADAALQQEKVTKQQVLVPAKLLSSSRNS